LNQANKLLTIGIDIKVGARVEAIGASREHLLHDTPIRTVRRY